MKKLPLFEAAFSINKKDALRSILYDYLSSSR